MRRRSTSTVGGSAATIAAVALASAGVLASVASARPAADDVSIRVGLGIRAAGGVGGTSETRTRGLDFPIVVEVSPLAGVPQQFSATIRLPEGLRWGSDGPDPSEGCVGTAPAVCTQMMTPNVAGTISGGWAWDVVADRTGFYEITATVQPTEPDPNAANNTTTFRFEVATPVSGGGAAPRAVASATRLTPASPRAGAPFSAGVRVSVDGSPVRPSVVTCTGTIAGRKLRGTPRARVGQAICTYRPPLAARGQWVRGSVVVSASGTRLVRRFTARLR